MIWIPKHNPKSEPKFHLTNCHVTIIKLKYINDKKTKNEIFSIYKHTNIVLDFKYHFQTPIAIFLPRTIARCFY